MADTNQGHSETTQTQESTLVQATQNVLETPSGDAPATATPKWFDSLPDALKVDKTIQKYDSQEKALQGLIESNKLLGKRVQSLPPEDLKKFLTADEIYEIAHSKGLPGSVDEYTLPKYDTMLPGDIGKTLKAKALEYGIAPDKLEGLIDIQNDLNSQMKNQERETWRTETLNVFGDKLGDTLKVAAKGLKEFGGDKVKDFLNQTGLGDHPLVIQHFADLGRAMAEDKIPSKITSAAGDEHREVTAKIKTLLKDPEFNRRWKSRDPMAMAQLDSLYKRQMELEN